MTIDRLREALDALEEPVFCRGAFPIDERLAIQLPDGDVGAVDDPGFIDWLVEHSEPAPFGKHHTTYVDREIRDALRLRARGDVRIAGFDPATILDEIESTLSPREHLVARLTDVIVYPPGGHFERHKDTPMTPDLVGTLIVNVPIEHAGGVFRIDANEVHEIDWSGPPDRANVHWVAIFTDVDHAVLPVERGHRVTIVYALSRTDRDRVDAAWLRRFAAVRAAIATLGDLPIMIPCTRHVIGTDEELVLGIDTLRGADRTLADALVAAGRRVTVRTCLAAREQEDDPGSLPMLLARGARDVAFARLAVQVYPHDVASWAPVATFVAPWGDGGGYETEEATDLRDLLEPVPDDRWIIRRNVAATLLGSIEFASDGYVGNAAVESYLYKLAALEVS